MKKIYLHQFLSRTGLFRSKKEIRDNIRNSKISVGEKIVKDLFYQVEPGKHHVFWKGEKIYPLRESIYIILNKPPGYICARLFKKDKLRGKKSVFEILGNEFSETIKNSLFTVGRLDEHSSGLLIITNDGKLASKITSPSSMIQKKYVAELEKPINAEQLSEIERGITITLEENGALKKYKIRKCKAKLISKKKAEITLTEGKKREVRRIFEALGNRVLKLKRISIGGISLWGLKQGKYKVVDREWLTERIEKKERT